MTNLILRSVAESGLLLAIFCASAQESRFSAQTAPLKNTSAPDQAQLSRDQDRLSILAQERGNIAARLLTAEKASDAAGYGRAFADLEAIDREIALTKKTMPTQSSSTGIAQARPLSVARAPVPRPPQNASAGDFATWDVFRNFGMKESQQ